MAFKLKMQAEQKLIDIYVSAGLQLLYFIIIYHSVITSLLRREPHTAIVGGSVYLTLNSRWKQVSHTKFFLYPKQQLH